MLPGSGGHIEDVYMYWEEKGEGDEDLIYPPHVLTFAAKKYNFAARPYYEEYLFDSEGNLQFVYGYNPMWAPDESAEDEQYEFRFYLNKGKLIKAVIKKRADDKQPYKEVFSGTALKGSFSKEFSTYKANADALRERLVKDGYAAVVVVNEAGKTYRVVCASFDTKEEAVTERGKFKAKYPDNQDFQSAWILYRK